MLTDDDPKWKQLHSGYRMPYDPRAALQKLRSQTESQAAWSELWDELHHQGDVGEASYAAVPELVRIHGELGQADWNAFALVATIELARDDKRNPSLPSWLERDYFVAIEQLAQLGVARLTSASDSESIRAIFSVIAISRGLRTLGRMLLLYSEDEWLDMEDRLMS